MIHADLNHPINILKQKVFVSIMADDGITSEIISFKQIQWGTVDELADTVQVAFDTGETMTAVYSTMDMGSI